MEEVDISMALSSAAFAVKDEHELVGDPLMRFGPEASEMADID